MRTFSDDEYAQENSRFMNDRYLTFLINDQLFAFPIWTVREIIGVPEIAVMPDYPDFIKGVINIRGEVIPVVDIRMRFHLKPAEYNAKTCIIIINYDECSVGFIVDTVYTVVNLEKEDISPSPRLNNRPDMSVTKVAKKDNGIIMIVEAEHLLTKEMRHKIAEMEF